MVSSSMRVDAPRPVRPDVGILQLAARAAHVDAAPRELTWVIGPRMVRPQATVFPLRLDVGGTTVLRAFYKTHRVNARTPREAEGKLRTFLRVLTRGPQLSEQYTRLSTSVPVAMPKFLAVDVERLTEVQTAIPGHPVNRVLWQAAPGRRGHASRMYHALGEAIAVIERCRDQRLADEEAPQLALELLSASVGPSLDAHDVRRLQGLLRELHAAAAAQGELSYSHGDLGRGNFFINRHGAGLIDALWSARWRGDDLAYHSVRLRHELPRLPAWTSHLVSQMLAGYGDERLPQQPQWLLTELWFEARVAAVRPRRPAEAFQRWQAVTRIHEALGPRVR